MHLSRSVFVAHLCQAMASPCKVVLPKHTARVSRQCCWGKSYSSQWLCPGSAPLRPGSQEGTMEHSSIATERALHTPVMLKEVLHCLDVRPGKVVLDMTFGAGGHSKAILRASPDVTVVALDRDPVAFQLAQQLAAEYPGQVHALLGRFSELGPLMAGLGLGPGSVDAALLDAGCSSMQMDCPERGFSLSKDGPLDMRMDGDRYPNMPRAADAVNALDQQALASVLAAYGEERHARKIAAAIAQARSVYPIVRTQQLASVVAGAFPACALYARRDRLQRPSHVATKTFQALRVFVNDELGELHVGLCAAEALLRTGGRLCALTFHSLEDRLVKRFLRGEDLAAPPRRSVRQRARSCRLEQEEDEEDEEGEGESTCWLCLQRKVMTPRVEEVQQNPRGRSAKLRVAQKR